MPSNTHTYPTTDAHVDDVEAVRRVCLDLAVRLHFRSLFLSLPALVFVAVIEGPVVSASRLWSWTAFVVVTGALAASRDVMRIRRGDTASVSIAALVVPVVLYSAAWGSAAIWLAPPYDKPEFTLVIVTLLAASATLNVNVGGGSRAFFLAGLVPVCVLPAAGLIARADRLGICLGLAAVGFMILMIGLHNEVTRHVVGALNLEHSNQRLRVDLDRQAHIDDLTGLPNRLSFIEMVARAMEDRDRPVLAVLLCDLDRFGVVNDALGHDHGDLLMVEVARRLVSPEVGGIACTKVEVARIGGDEFGFVVVSDSSDTVNAVAAGIHRCFASVFDVGRRTIRVTATVGVAMVDRGQDGPSDALRHADAALQQAKRAGRARTEVFDDQSRLNLAQRIDDETELRRALEAGEIVAWFQPVVSLCTNGIIGAEALARWEHPERGTLFPNSFISLAEECGLIDQVGRAVLRHSLQLRRALADLGVSPDFTIRVNVSAHQLVPGAGAAFTQMVSDAGVDPTGICFEVTESALADDAETAVTILAEWRAAGHRIELDDFGTGFSSLSLVRRLPLDGVKIDRAFVRDMVTDRSDRSMVEVIIDMGRRLGLSLTAEGVETVDQAAALRELRCPEAQGFLWSKAIPANQLAEMLLKGAPWATSHRLEAVNASETVFAVTMHA